MPEHGAADRARSHTGKTYRVARAEFAALVGTDPSTVFRTELVCCDSLIVELLAKAKHGDEAIAHLEQYVAPASEDLAPLGMVAVAAMVRAFQASAVPRPVGDWPPSYGLLRSIEVGNAGLARFPDSQVLAQVVAACTHSLRNSATIYQGEWRTRVRATIEEAARRLREFEPKVAQELAEFAKTMPQ